MENVYREYIYEDYIKNSLITGHFINGHKELKKVLLRYDLASIMAPKIVDIITDGSLETQNFYIYLKKYFSSEEIYQIIADYGFFLDVVYVEITNPLNKEDIYNQILTCIYNDMMDRIIDYEHYEALPNAFKEKYPDIFISEDAPIKIKQYFYTTKIDSRCLLEYQGREEELLKYVKEKNPKFYLSFFRNDLLGELYKNYVEKDYITMEQLFEIAILFSDINNAFRVNKKHNLSMKIKNLEQGEYHDNLVSIYTHFENQVREIMKKCPILHTDIPICKSLRYKYPNEFKDMEASEKLRELLKGNITLEKLKDKIIQKEIIEKEIPIISCLYDEYGSQAHYSRENINYLNNYMTSRDFFSVLNNSYETLEKVILGECNVENFVMWYKAYHFVPHYVVVNDFPICDTHKFIASSRKWSKIMSNMKKIEKYGEIDHILQAILRLAIVFGVFDNDDKGYNDFMKLLFTFPKTFTCSQKEGVNGLLIQALEGYDLIDNKLFVLKENQKEMDDFDYNPFIYRNIISELSDYQILPYQILHTWFGGLPTSYNPKFREFLLSNLKRFKEDNTSSLISKICGQFENILTFNRGRGITYKNVISYIQNVAYTTVCPGHEELAYLASKTGYSEGDFHQLEDIYFITKKRYISSIPRIEGTYNNYSYEVLRLDDPLALVIGDLTDCCQRLNEVGEDCMKHSTISDDGRVFVVRDCKKNIVSQSWMWRNKNIICFDNIEIPKKILHNHEHYSFAEEILKIYQKASQELIEYDDKKYKELLDKKAISKELYENNKLSCVTVGLGYNDIADVIQNNLTWIEEPVQVNSMKYIYTDASTQYLLEGEYNYLSNDIETYRCYKSEFSMMDSFNAFDEYFIKHLIYENIYSYSFDDYKELLANYYHIEEENLRIIQNHNLALIYEETEQEICIKDILYHTEQNTEKQIENIYDLLKEKNKAIDMTIMNQERSNKFKFLELKKE